MTIYFDFETRSACDLKTHGADVYARHPSTEVLCMAIKKPGKKPAVWHPYGEQDWTLTDPPKFKLLDELPQELVEYIKRGGEMVAHNASFDLAIWNHVAVRLYGFPPLKLEQVRCTMAQALTMALPASLAQLGEVLEVVKKKDIDGSLAMRKMCAPPFRFEPHLFAALIDYCAQDVDTMAEIDQRLARLTPHELKVWQANHRINERGLRIDFDLVEAVHKVNALEDLHLEDMAKPLGLTPAMIRSPQQFKAWALEQGVELTDLDKKTLGALELDNPMVQQGLEIREQLCRSSIKKFEAMVQNACDDGRARGNHQYHRATTGRFAGSGIQVQNMFRPMVEDTDKLAEEILNGQPLTGYGKPIKSLLASVVRSCIIPDEGNEFICADFASIESKVLFWFAMCERGLEVYRSGGDLYCVTASGIFNRQITKADKERQIGKIAVLACGYGGGEGAFQGMCDAYKLSVCYDLRKQAVMGYRETYPEVVEFWAQCERDAMAAIKDPQHTHGAFHIENGALCCTLPSGRVIRWNSASIGENRFGRPGIKYMGLGLNRKWIELETYGGDLCQSMVQGASRDLLAHALVELDRLGWHPVLHVHDEIMCEEPIGAHTGEELESIMCTLPSWATGLPVSAEGWKGRRYRK